MHSSSLVFADERPVTAGGPCWTVLVVDDEPSVHEVTRLALNNFEYEGRRLRFLSAYSAEEAKGLLASTPDIALILLDVVMETDSAGLEVISYARDELGNASVRIVLRTGQPGQAPERQVVLRYDIHDYKTKVELTASKLYTSVLSSLRTYRHLRTLEDLRRQAEATTLALQRFFPGEFLALLDKRSIVDVRLGDQIQREMTVMFADIRGFTARSELMSPAECFSFVNELFSELSPLIRAHRGFIDKYLGDGFLALFPGSADDAMQAAVAIERRTARRNAERGDDVQLGIGLHTGVLMFGTVGEPERMEATVLSDAVNIASRLEELTKQLGARVVLSEETLVRSQRPEAYDLRSIGKLRVAGKLREIAVFELLDADSERARASKRATAAEFARGVEAFHRGDPAEACVLFRAVLDASPDDEAARMYLRLAAQAILRELAPHEGDAP